MEELLSTESLDREILEDARRKAQRILKTADETAASAAAQWEKKTGRAVARAGRRYQARIEKDREEIMARLPLDKRRSRLEKIDRLLREAMEKCLAELPRPKLLAILEAELRERLEACPECGDAAGRVMSRGLSEDEREGLLKKYLPRGNWTPDGDYTFFNLPGNFPALIIDTPAVRLTASVDLAAEALLKDKRAELTAALLGEDHA
jgi:hypothetical protein